MDAYVVIVDTGQNYFELRQKMFNVNIELGLEIDTMGRAYNVKNNTIALPEDDEDEIYAGDYYPRRYPSVVLSLEYISHYFNYNYEDDKTIALVMAITEDLDEAKALLEKAKIYSSDPFIVESNIYIGCMH